jgi:hypothetical protein
MKQHILRARRIDNRRIAISVLPQHAQSVYEHVKNKGIEVDPLSEETFEIRDYSLDCSGKLVSEEHGPVRSFTAALSSLCRGCVTYFLNGHRSLWV